MASYKKSLLVHARAVQNCAPRFNLRANLDLLNFRLTLTGRNLYYDFFPQFISVDKERGIRYAPTLREETRGFIGWLPYFNKRWPLATDKLLFKKFCAEKGLRTPRVWTAPDDSVRDFVVKQKASSFGKGIRGPFKILDRENAEHKLSDKEYYEQFIMGKIAKAWYWNDKVICLEIFAMPTVTGNGRRSVYDLIVRKSRKRRRAPERAQVAALVQYQDVALDDVMPRGKEIVADFRYVSPLFEKKRSSANVLPQYADTELGRQFADAGPLLWAAIPEEIRKATLWTLDAIVEEEAGRAWFLEMNCNPLVHPDAYFSIFESLFGPAETVVSPSVETYPPGHVAGMAPAGITRITSDAPPAAPMPPGNGGEVPPEVR